MNVDCLEQVDADKVVKERPGGRDLRGIEQAGLGLQAFDGRNVLLALVGSESAPKSSSVSVINSSAERREKTNKLREDRPQKKRPKRRGWESFIPFLSDPDVVGSAATACATLRQPHHSVLRRVGSEGRELSKSIALLDFGLREVVLGDFLGSYAQGRRGSEEEAEKALRRTHLDQARVTEDERGKEG